MTIHEMKLQARPFAVIASGAKTIESRLYDEKRQKIQVGDQILFRNMDAPDETVLTKVVELLKYQTFSDLFVSCPAHLFGGESADALLEQIRDFYSEEDEKRDGVLGIRISKIT